MPSVTLRQWRDADLEPLAEMSADPEVMRFFPKVLTREESADFMERIRRIIDQQGWGWWAVEVDGEFAGMTGLSVPRFALPFMPCTEIAWRLRREFWGRGIAIRAAREALAYGFGTLKLSEIVSFTAKINVPSWRLMERLGFSRDVAGDFDHPALPVGHPLRHHVLYRLKRDECVGLDVKPCQGSSAC
jgi:RimJ/RimL family protein N-acetyltransferase